MIRTMRSTSASVRRGAFTLLEVLLSMAIALLLLGAVYFAMDFQVRVMQDSRDMIQETTLVRVLLNRITVDFTTSLTPIPTGSQSSSTGTGTTTTTTATGSGAATGTGTSGTATGTASGSSSSSSSSMESEEPITTSVIPFQAGVIGTNTTLSIYMSRVATNSRLLEAEDDGSPDTARPADIRRITYWLAANGGLARQETAWITSDEAQSTEPDLSNENQFVIAEEVTAIEFSYWDGTAWLGEWDGTQRSEDNKTPIGPPMAIGVRLSIRNPNNANEPKVYNHVIALHTAGIPASLQQSTQQPTEMNETTTESTTTQPMTP